MPPLPHEPAWFTTAPVFAFQKLLKKVGWQTTDVDLWESTRLSRQ
jgi:acetyl-CoA C-acetyltransferase